MYHLILLLERLMRGDVDRTDMDAFHSLLYKHNCTTTAEDWKRIGFRSSKDVHFLRRFCVPKEKRERAFRMVPEFIKRCDFMIILAPGCTHFDKIDPRTGRKMNLCYRTYRLRAKCLRDVQLVPHYERRRASETSALVRSGEKTKLVSDFECLKLAVERSIFECCETNHAKIKTCRRGFRVKT